MRLAWRLAGLGNPLHVVNHAQEAADYLSERLLCQPGGPGMPTLMLLDLKLPSMARLELVKWICQQDGIRSLRVVVLSSSNLAADVEHAKGLKVSGYWLTPPEPHKLKEIAASLDGLLRS
jgi:CheY-like chemotaxis protein